VHFAAGPWFTVQKCGQWLSVDRIWISNGRTNDIARVEIRLELEEVHDDNEKSEKIVVR
jgi:hypothetical protein